MFIKYIRQLFSRASQPREYYVSYSVSLKNLSGTDNNVIVMLPVPPNEVYQIVAGIPAFTWGYRKTSDVKFSNQVVFWQGILQPNAEKYYAENFEIAVSPRKVVINPSWTLRDYLQAKDSPEYNLYLQAEEHLSGQNERIRNLASSILSSEQNLLLSVQKLYEYVIGNLDYGNPIRGLYSYGDALGRKTVDCGGFSSLLGSLCRAISIPAKIISGFWAESDIAEASKKMHAWLEILLPNGEWLPLDPSIDYLRRHGRSSKEGGFGVTGSDRIAFSSGSDIPLQIGEHSMSLDILQNPVVFAANGADSLEIKTNFVAQK